MGLANIAINIERNDKNIGAKYIEEAIGFFKKQLYNEYYIRPKMGLYTAFFMLGESEYLRYLFKIFEFKEGNITHKEAVINSIDYALKFNGGESKRILDFFSRIKKKGVEKIVTSSLSKRAPMIVEGSIDKLIKDSLSIENIIFGNFKSEKFNKEKVDSMKSILKENDLDIYFNEELINIGFRGYYLPKAYDDLKEHNMNDIRFTIATEDKVTASELLSAESSYYYAENSDENREKYRSTLMKKHELLKEIFASMKDIFDYKELKVFVSSYGYKSDQYENRESTVEVMLKDIERKAIEEVYIKPVIYEIVEEDNV